MDLGRPGSALESWAGKSSICSMAPWLLFIAFMAGESIALFKRYLLRSNSYFQFVSLLPSYIPSGKRLPKTMENRHVQWENPLFLWPFSIAMLVITRGYHHF